jgi:succinate dehydrogenase membrane anchor subunit
MTSSPERPVAAAGPGPQLETPLARVRGLGSARHGAEHWWHERTSSIGLFVLFVWLAVSLARLPDLGQPTIAFWLTSPLAAVPMLLLVALTFRHLRDGLKVIVEDYVHEEGNRFFLILLIDFAGVAAAALALFCVLRIAFAPAPAG